MKDFGAALSTCLPITNLNHFPVISSNASNEISLFAFLGVVSLQEQVCFQIKFWYIRDRDFGYEGFRTRVCSVQHRWGADTIKEHTKIQPSDI